LDAALHFESQLTRFPKKGGEYFFVVPDAIADQFVEGRKPARVRCRVNDRVDFQCAIRPMGGGGFYINMGTPIRQQAKVTLGQKLFVSIEKDESKYGRDMPEELHELLELDEEGNKLFQALLPSHQRGIIHYVAGARSVQVRIDRAIMMINRLKKPKIEEGR
jgi:hypothetical protein